MIDLELDIDSSRGRRAGLEEALRRAVRSGSLPAGTRLPSSRALASDLRLARATVVSVYEQLTAEGLLQARQGQGTAVASIGVAASRPVHRAPAGRPALDTDLLPGAPDPSSFPRRSWGTALRRTLATAPDHLLGYGDPRGAAPLRIALADYLGRARAVSVDADQLSIFGGMATAVSFLATALRRAGIERIAVEDPSLPWFRSLMTNQGLVLVPVAVDQEGVRVGDLAAADVGAVFVTPSHQYPLGVPMSPLRRLELAAWARATDAWVVEDDYDGEFRYDRQPVGTLQGLAPDRVVYAGTASKALVPGLRIAWLAVPDGLADHLAATKGVAGQCSAIDQLALAHFVEAGSLDRHVRAMRVTYRRRRDLMVHALGGFPSLRVEGMAAGLHVTATIHGEVPEATLVAAAAEAGLALAGLAPHWCGAPRAEGLVLGFGRPSAHAYPRLLDRLGRVLAAQH